MYIYICFRGHPTIRKCIKPLFNCNSMEHLNPLEFPIFSMMEALCEFWSACQGCIKQRTKAFWLVAPKTTFETCWCLFLYGICIANSNSKLVFDSNKTWLRPKSLKALKNTVHNSCIGSIFSRRNSTDKVYKTCPVPRFPRFFGTLSRACLIVPKKSRDSLESCAGAGFLHFILGNLGPVHFARLLKLQV